MKTLSDVSMEDVVMGRTGTHLILTERELQVIYRALKVYEYEDLMYDGVGAVPVDEEEKERETVVSLLDNLENMGVKA